MRLTDFASDTYSQFGEDGMISQIYRLIGEDSRFCVEFGASDGTSCSNTKALREQGWEGLLIESNSELFGKLQDQVKLGVNTQNVEVTAGNINHILGRTRVDFISIDVDGTDYDIWEAMTHSPRVVCIEHNASIPPHVSVHQGKSKLQFGASALALCELADTKGYFLVGLNKGNLFFVLKEYEEKFAEYETRLDQLFDPDWLCYFSTDFQGRGFVTGAEPPWGVSPIPFVGDVAGDPVTILTRNVDSLVEAFEDMYGSGRFIPSDAGIDRLAVEVPDSHRMTILEHLLKGKRGLVLIDISNHAPDANFDWIILNSEKFGYASRVIPAGVIALIPIY